ncbi:MAG TPA: glycosyltransferase family 87 protein [Tepidisphaeraceae bacterium]|jgi:hypothetical protein|nr:glycosyltransferase family 87 protein [Tepidisphaeraceae bacterium]
MNSNSLPVILQPTRLRRRLWQGAIALAIFIGTLSVGNFVIPPEKALDRHVLGQDFIAFYTAGTFAREGRFDDIYNLDSVRDFQHQVAKDAQLEMGDSIGPFWNPPFYAWVFAPLSRLSFYHAVLVWTGVNVLALLGSILLLCKMLPTDWEAAPFSLGWFATRRDWRNWLLVPLLTIVSMPLIQALSHGQNTCMSLFILCLMVTAWRAKQAEWAGICCGLLFYKPQLAAVLAVILFISLGFRALLGLTFTGSLLFVATGLSMPGTIQTYLHQLPINLHWMQAEHSYLWERHVTLRAFWRLMVQGYATGEANWIVMGSTIVSCVILGTFLVRAAYRSRRSADEPWTGETAAGSRDRLIAATIATMPLLMPFYFDYDLLLLAVPAVLIAGEILHHDERSRSDKWIARTFGLLFLWMMFNPAIGKMTHVNGTVILLTTLAVQLAVRASRNVVVGGERVTVDVENLTPLYRMAA